MHESKTIGIWIRVSTEDQARGESPEHHEFRARHYAEAKGWEVKTVYHLEGISGKSVMELPETKRMLQDIRSGYISGIIFSKLARLARNTRELLDFADIFKNVGADLISLQESIDTSTPAGRLFYTMIAAMAQWEREEISSRVAASVPIRAKLGKPLGGAAPFGYTWVDKQLVINEQEAPIRRLSYDIFLMHKRLLTVANILNEKGYRTRNGSKFTKTTIDRLLRDTIAIGKKRANYSKSLGKGKKWEIKPESEWVYSDIPAIVSKETWQACQAIINEQDSKKIKRSKRVAQLFSGIVTCGCGKKLYVQTNSTKYVCTGCRKTRIDAQDLEEIFQDQLKSFLVSGSHLESVLIKADETIHSKEEQLSLLQSQANKIHLELEKLVQLHLTGEIPKEGFGLHYTPLFEQHKQILSSIPELQSEVDFLKIEHLNSDFVVQEAKSLFDQWPKLDKDGKRQIIEQVTNSILIANDEIKIQFSYLPLLENDPNGARNFMDSYWPPA